jgi:hypothetical protein
MPSTSDQQAHAALELAALGWPVLPCHHPTEVRCSCGDAHCASPAKHPHLRRGLHQATTSPRTIRRWWRTWPEANVAVRTGAHPAGAGVVVIDLDAGGDATLAQLQREHSPLAPTLTAITGGGGRHLWFAHPGGRVPNSARRLGEGVDVRGDGGYVLTAPSRHISGGEYRWQPGPLALLPDWLHRLCLPATPAPVRGSDRPVDASAWAHAALVDEVSSVRTSVPGHRNDTLNRAAFSLGQLVGGGHLDEDQVIEQLTIGAVEVGLPPREIRPTIASGLHAGEAHPRHPRR